MGSKEQVLITWFLSSYEFSKPVVLLKVSIQVRGRYRNKLARESGAKERDVSH